MQAETTTMTPPTEQECRELSERWPEHFTWSETGGMMLHSFLFTLEISPVHYWPNCGVWRQSGRKIESALGLAALAAKLVEIEPRLVRVPKRNGIEYEWAIVHAGGAGLGYSDHAPTPWACLLQMEEVK